MQYDLYSHQQDRLPRILLCLHISSSERLAMDYTKVALSTPLLRQNRFTSSRPDAVLVAPISAKTGKQQASNEGGPRGGFLGVAGGN